MQSSALIELYAGAPAKAVELIDRRLPAIRRAFLLRIYAVRAFTAYLRATAWLARSPRVHLSRRASIRRACNGIGTDAVTRSVPLLAGAGLAVLRGDLDAAVAGSRDAATAFDAADMMPLASAARCGSASCSAAMRGGAHRPGECGPVGGGDRTPPIAWWRCSRRSRRTLGGSTAIDVCSRAT